MEGTDWWAEEGGVIPGQDRTGQDRTGVSAKNKMTKTTKRVGVALRTERGVGELTR